jgi:hypothetical protein
MMPLPACKNALMDDDGWWMVLSGQFVKTNLYSTSLTEYQDWCV